MLYFQAFNFTENFWGNMGGFSFIEDGKKNIVYFCLNLR